MKQSDLNHLRRLVGWISCEIGQGPAELVATVRNIASKIQLPSDPVAAAEAKQRLVEAHDKARRVPAYIRAAVVALEKALASRGEVVDAEGQTTGCDSVQVDRLSKLQGRLVDKKAESQAQAAARHAARIRHAQHLQPLLISSNVLTDVLHFLEGLDKS